VSAIVRATDLLGDTVFEVARRLLGCRLRTEIDGQATAVMLTEVEAYAGADDPASHAFRGRTERNGSMFGPAGTLYVYRSYGIHWCMNVVVGEEGLPHAVLLRAGEITEGEPVIRQRRERTDHLTDGPGKLCQALAVTGEHDGTSVFAGPVQLIPGELPPEAQVLATPRIGISKAQAEPWRYVVAPRDKQSDRKD
jgi:DNA-3-methyladenine glycosylase